MFYRIEVKYGPKWDWSSVEQQEAFYQGDIEAWMWVSDAENWLKEQSKLG
jgi:hypothetical protein